LYTLELFLGSVGKSVSTVDSTADLDDWVDKVFDPIIYDGASHSLNNPAALKQSLRGNGDQDLGLCLVGLVFLILYLFVPIDSCLSIKCNDI